MRTPDLTGRRILVVDDHADTLEMDFKLARQAVANARARGEAPLDWETVRRELDLDRD